LFLLIVVFISSCNITKRVPDNEYLLRKNKIITVDKKIDTEDLYDLIRQQPNRKILGFVKFHLRMYNLADFGKERKIKKWIKKTIGEPPVLLDTLLTNTTIHQQKSYLKNKGYFNAVVDKDISFYKKKADVKYIINVGDQYLINKVDYIFQDMYVESSVLSDTVNSLIKKSTPYDVDVFNAERERLTKMLKNKGFYNFSREFIFFEIDSAVGNFQVNLSINIKNPVDRLNDSLQTLKSVNHKRFIINNIYIFPQQKSLMQEISGADTLLVNIAERKNKNILNPYYFVFNDKPLLNPKVITQAVFFKKKRMFSLNDAEQTYKTLSELKNFRFINIQFIENKDTLQENDYLNALDCRIELTRMPRHFYNIAAEATNSAGNLGVAGNISYQNRNLFRGAEIFNIKLNCALEVQKIFGDETADEVIDQLPFNTVETGVELNVELPRFLIPISPEKFPKYFRPKTTIKTGLNFQQRADYTRYILNSSFGYEWKESESKKHILTPIEISSIKIEPDSSFLEIINSIKDKRIQLSYNDHLSMALRYSFIFNNQKVNKLLNFSYFRGNFESSGNLLRLASKVINMQQDEMGSYKIFKIRYSQYIKADADYRFYNIVNQHSSLVYRFTLGLAVPYGNIDIMPFDKSFYAGGANGLIAWKLYDLGPGGYSDTATAKFYKTGDVHLETNVEYRFDIYKYLKGALFLDAGNVWLREKNIQYPNAEFQFNDFYKEIAIGCGVGTRLDFSFFIIRLDAAIPLRDPRRVHELRWVYDEMKLTKVNFNIGIGYPF